MNNTAALSPTQPKERIASLDVIRGAAILGLLVVNINGFALPLGLSFDPAVYGADGPNLWTWIILSIFFEGTQWGLFTLLFGAGVILFTERLDAAQRPNATDLYFRRYLWMIVFGMVHGFLLLWVGDVLFFYGVVALFVYTFRKAAPATLLWIALGGVVFNAAWNQLDVSRAVKAHDRREAAVAAQQAGEALTHEQREAIEVWDGIVTAHRPDAAALQKIIDAHRTSYLAQVAQQAPKRHQAQTSFLHRVFFDIFSVMLIGMALFKMGLLQVGRPRKIYWRMALIGYGIGLSVNFLEVRYLIAADFSVLAQLQVGVMRGASYDVGRLAVTIGHTGLLMLLCNASILGGLKRRLAAVGQMAFTNYVSHSIICAFVFYGIGFGLYGQLQPYQLYYVVFAIWAFQLALSPIWLAHYRYGPLEWLWRSLTYGKRQPMRRGSVALLEPT